MTFLTKLHDTMLGPPLDGDVGRMTNTQKIYWAITSIAGECDGAKKLDAIGFSAWDAETLSGMAKKPYDQWTDRMFALAYRRLEKYHKQLTYLGIPYASLAQPATVASRPPNRLIATVAGTQIRADRSLLLGKNARGEEVMVARFAYDAVLKDDLKQAGGGSARFTGKEVDDPRWEVPLALGEDFVVWARTHRFVVDPEILRRLDLLDTKVDTVYAASVEAAQTLDIPNFAVQDLYPHQRIEAAYCIRKLKDPHKGAYLGSEQGTGKTPTSLAIAQALNAFPLLILTRFSILDTFAREAAHWLPTKSVAIVDSTNRKKGVPDADIIITNYDSLISRKYTEKDADGNVIKTRSSRGLVDDLLKKPFRMVIGDEGQVLISHTSKRARAFRKLAEHVDYRVLLLSGTPIKQAHSEALHPLMLINRLEEMGGYSYFVSHYTSPRPSAWSPSKLDLSHSINPEGLFRAWRASNLVRHQLAEVMPDLPPLTRQIVTVPIENRAEYVKIERDYVAYLRSIENWDEVNRAVHLQRAAALYKAASLGALRADFDYLDMLAYHGRPAPVFAWNIEVVEALAAHLGVPMIRGGVSRDARTRAIDAFQAGELPFLVLNLDAGSTGLTLTRAADVVFCQFAGTPDVIDQAEHRILRIGQTASHVQSHWLVPKDTIVERRVQVLQDRKLVVSAALDGEANEFAIARTIDMDLLQQYA